MKLKNYEKRIFLFGSVFFFFLLLGCFFLFSLFWKREDYQMLSGLVFSKNTIQLMVSTEELSLLYQNNFFYLENKKTSYQIKTVTKNVLKRKSTSYHEVFLRCPFDFTKKENDVVSLVFICKRQPLISIYRIIWKGD